MVCNYYLLYFFCFISTIFYTKQELDSQQDWVKVHTCGIPIHSDSVRRIIYCQSDEATISCCQDQKTSLVIKHIRDEWDPYVFHIQHVMTY